MQVCSATATGNGGRRRRIAATAAAALLLSACLGPDPNLTESGEGKPEITVEFPAEVPAGSTQEAIFTVTNPGPGAIDVLAIAFARLGDPKLPQPIVDVAPRGRSAVLEIDPKPRAVSSDGVVYAFGTSEGEAGEPILGEGESLEITFRLSMPATPGPAGNSVQAYDGEDVDRARGVRLETEILG
jgi:hypothetical protein